MSPEYKRAWYQANKERIQAQKERRARELLDNAPKICCACGCGTLIPSITINGDPAKYKHGHNATSGRFQPGQEAWNKGQPNPRTAETHLGKKLSENELERRKATRIANNGGVYITAAPFVRGYRRSTESKAKQSETLRSLNLRSGEQNPAWKGGISKLPYPWQFNKALKRTILQRDNYTCQRCKRTQQQLGWPLHVHHLDHDKQNIDPSNLVASCGSCNSWAQWHRDESFAT